MKAQTWIHNYLADGSYLDMDKLVSVKGLVIRATPIIPDMKEGVFGSTILKHEPSD